MSTHVITDPAVSVTDPTSPPTPTTPDPTTGAATAVGGAVADSTSPATVVPYPVAAWLRLGAAMAEEAPAIADRDDLVVSIAPGAGHGAPACFLPAHAAIEVDATHLDAVDPTTIDPARVADQNRIPTAWGLFTHECAHAHHSRWNPPPAAPAGATAAAKLLEESRIEAAQIRRRPDDRRWLRASAVSLILDDHPSTTTDAAPELTRWAGGSAAALLLARVDAGVLTPYETRPVTDAVTVALGANTLTQLRELWCHAHATADNDAETMTELGRRWCEALGLDPTATPPTAASDPAGSDPVGSDAAAGSEAAAGSPSEVSLAVADSARRVSGMVALESATVSAAEEAAAAEEEAAATDAADAARADKAADRVFPINRSTVRARGRVKLGATRAPTATERAAARVLGRALDTAGIRDRVAVKAAAQLPPGRLSVRGARAVDAQRAAGAIPTATPFTRVTRTVVPTPPLRVGVACDVSGSMGAFTGPVASAAWILAAAAAHTTVAATTASVLFGSSVLALTRPGQVPTKVTDFPALDRYEDVPGAIDALDGVLGLSRPGAARLLVIISDGHYAHQGRTAGQARVDRLRAGGCGVLWLGPARARPLRGATVEQLSDPTTTARVIGRAAVAALHATR